MKKNSPARNNATRMNHPGLSGGGKSEQLTHSVCQQLKPSAKFKKSAAINSSWSGRPKISSATLTTAYTESTAK